MKFLENLNLAAPVLTYIDEGANTILITTLERKKIILETQPPKENFSSVEEMFIKRPFIDEIPKHKITFKNSFYLGKHEITQAQWKAIMGNNPSKFSDCGGNCPVENVSWFEVKEFIAELNAKNDGFEYRLPSEAEWEYAARAGSSTAFAFGDDLGLTQATFCADNCLYGSYEKGKPTVVGNSEIIDLSSQKIELPLL